MSFTHPMSLEEITEQMVALAMDFGVSDAQVVDAGALKVNPELVRYCREPQCPSYGTSGNCPPHGPSAREFQLSLEWYEKAVVFKVDVPVAVLMTDERLPVSRKIHETAAILEQFAKNAGCVVTMGVATGGCRALFCSGFEACLKLQGGLCRHAGLAKPSMSGLGVDFTVLSTLAGWTVNTVTAESSSSGGEMGALAGFVLLGGTSSEL
ncbi:DUF2284 domain-containing protein [Desulfoluna sp.]|uniref:DUF2284 domain-containing protein n=1 Tax=Desulfoluna sp. TaxID=2045199 RepID=UPI00262A0A7B|nr:DUF2284 domain-containing protein [Desulfoluna sp.]